MRRWLPPVLSGGSKKCSFFFAGGDRGDTICGRGAEAPRGLRGDRGLRGEWVSSPPPRRTRAGGGLSLCPCGVGSGLVFFFGSFSACFASSAFLGSFACFASAEVAEAVESSSSSSMSEVSLPSAAAALGKRLSLARFAQGVEWIARRRPRSGKRPFSSAPLVGSVVLSGISRHGTVVVSEGALSESRSSSSWSSSSEEATLSSSPRLFFCRRGAPTPTSVPATSTLGGAAVEGRRRSSGAGRSRGAMTRARLRRSLMGGEWFLLSWSRTPSLRPWRKAGVWCRREAS
mmetsp:Transcript_1204/g.4066  ORF Transcript_1204/g.4066 Transcript_1204/m.4066 type:complete len:288 (-) Transcript_1204:975-1838(-)